MPEEMRDPNPKKFPGSDLFPFRFRIHRLPEDCDAVTYEEKKEQLLRQLKEAVRRTRRRCQGKFAEAALVERGARKTEEGVRAGGLCCFLELRIIISTFRLAN